MRALLLTLALLVVTTADATAATHHAAPGSTRVTAPCELADPCRIDVAMQTAGFGDDVALAGGDYFQTGTTPWPVLPDVKTAVRVHGEPGGLRPVLHGKVATVATPFVSIQAGGTLADVEVRSTSNPFVNYTYAVQVGNGGALERSIVRLQGSEGTTGSACSMVGGVVSSTVCHGYGEDTVNALTGNSGAAVTYRVRNVTAITTAPDSAAIQVGASSQTSSMEVTNSVARGTRVDVEARVGISSGRATLRIDHSNWTAQSTGGPGVATITPGEGNQFAATATPVPFTDAAAGDFRPVAGSGTIDAGADDPSLGTLAVDGTARTLGAATDMGAYEHVPPPPPDPIPGVPVTPPPAGPAGPAGPVAPPASPTPAADHVAPRLTRLRVATPKRRARSRAVVVRFRLSEAARVRLALTGRKRSTVVVRGKAGANRVRLTRPRGRYRLTARATDTAGNRSAARTKRFTVRR